MGASLLVTGTDTAIGKTTVSCGMAAALHASGRRVAVFKPCETDCPNGPNGSLMPRDGTLLQFFSSSTVAIDDICPLRFAEPLAPLVAARRARADVDVDALHRRWERLDRSHDVTLVEGAGGLLVPLAEGVDFAELARRWNLPVLVVVGNRLGAINHALLTIATARSRGLDVIGYVVNTLEAEPTIAAATNAALLEELLGPPLAVVPYLPPLTATEAARATLAATFAPLFDWDRLQERIANEHRR